MEDTSWRYTQQEFALYDCHSDSYELIYEPMVQDYHDFRTQIMLPSLGGSPGMRSRIANFSINAMDNLRWTFSLRGVATITKENPFELRVTVVASTGVCASPEMSNDIHFYATASLRKNGLEIEKKGPLHEKNFNHARMEIFRDLGTVTFTLPQPYDLEPLFLVMDGGYFLGDGYYAPLQAPIPLGSLDIKIKINVIRKFKSDVMPSPNKIGKFIEDRYYNQPRYYENPAKRLFHGK